MRFSARILGCFWILLVAFACQKPKQGDYKIERNNSLMKHVRNTCRSIFSWGILAGANKLQFIRKYSKTCLAIYRSWSIIANVLEMNLRVEKFCRFSIASYGFDWLDRVESYSGNIFVLMTPIFKGSKNFNFV